MTWAVNSYGAGDHPLDSLSWVTDDQEVTQDNLQGLLFALVEQARSTAIRMAGDPERETTCHFCEGDVALWESLLVMQLAGVPAHVQCPAELLAAKLRRVAPLSEFGYATFSLAVDEHLHGERATSAAGVINGCR